MPHSKPNFLHELFARSSRELLKVLTRRVGAQDAPDLLQEAYVRLLRQTSKEQIAEPQALLHTIAVNLAKDYRRRQSTQRKHVDFSLNPENIAAAGPILEQQIEAEERIRRMLAAIETLPPRCREVLILRRFEDLHQSEIAARLGISRNMVEKHLRLALKRLQTSLR